MVRNLNRYARVNALSPSFPRDLVMRCRPVTGFDGLLEGDKSLLHDRGRPMLL